MGECPEWYAWASAARWLNTDATRLEDHPEGLLWRNRAFVGMDAEARAEKQRQKRGAGRQAR